MTSCVLATLRAREMIAQVTDETGLEQALGKPGLTFYVGFDPTAESLHVGHLLPIMAMAHLQRAGHTPLALIGGATGMIGDPSGRAAERQLLTADQVKRNVEALRRQLSLFLAFEGQAAAKLVDNYDWISTFSYIDWLRDVGKHFSVNAMLAKESVRRRLEDRDQGISYTEFSYMLLQAYDFLHLYDLCECRLQAGGSDQWGNITAGIDLVRRTRRAQTYGMTFPIVTAANGEKFGKSAGNAVWLDPNLTSPYAFHQFWVRVDDADVEACLKRFTFLDLDAIQDLLARHRDNPSARLAQRALATAVTRIVHGDQAAAVAEHASGVLFGSTAIDGRSDAELREIFAEVPSTQVQRDRLRDGIALTQLLHSCALAPSKTAARRLIEGGGVYVNNLCVNDPACLVTLTSLASASFVVLRVGRKNYHLVEVTQPALELPLPAA